MTERVLGVDLGQASDYTALCLLDKTTIPVGEPYEIDPTIETNGLGGVRLTKQTYQPVEDHFRVTHLARLPLGMSYPDQARHIADLMRRVQQDGPCRLVVDRTGVGRAVVDLLRQDGLELTAVTISGGMSVTGAGEDLVIPKRDLIAAALVALQSDQLKIAARLPHAATLVTELQAMRVTISPSGHDSYNARVGEHDDLVLALCLALWMLQSDERIPLIETTYFGDTKSVNDSPFTLDDHWGNPWRW